MFPSAAAHRLLCPTCHGTSSPIPSQGLRRPRCSCPGHRGRVSPTLPLWTLCSQEDQPEQLLFLHPCSFPASCPKPQKAGGSSVYCCLSQPPSVVEVSASPRRWSRIPGRWEAADMGQGGEVILLHRAEGKLPKLPPAWHRSGNLDKGLALPQLWERRWCWRQRNDQHCNPCLTKSGRSLAQLPILLPALPGHVLCSSCSTRLVPAGLGFPVPNKKAFLKICTGL